MINKGINIEVIKEISKLKNEPEWMLNYRLTSFDCFKKTDMPSFGPALNINFDNITYFKRINDAVYDNWKDVPKDIEKTFKDIGIQDAEEKYLGGVSTQYESEVIYHKMMEYFTEKKVIFVDTDTALKQYSDLFKKYFNKIVNYDENKFTALNGSVWSGGSFIYVPKGVKLDRPLQSYFRINTKEMGQFERTIIIVDEDAELEYIEGCTAPNYTEDSIHAAVVEIYVMKNAKCKYITIQNWASNIYNLVTKRAIVEESGIMEWIDGNIGSKVTMKYPSVILNGEYAKGTCISIAVAGKGQTQDAGAKMIHLAPHTKSNIVAKSIARDGGNATYRGTIKIDKKAIGSHSSVKCDTVVLDELSKSDTIPKNIVLNDSSTLEHEATVSKISEEKLFYLMSRGIDKEKANELIIMGFLDNFRKELPMEYAVELNQLLKK
ncbi:MAG: Fe-S cluster assembly protein SufB [Bacilli bacterium]|nr:Fe-S cluster assembly protein SufB [Bacilli bacterium]